MGSTNRKGHRVSVEDFLCANCQHTEEDHSLDLGFCSVLGCRCAVFRDADEEDEEPEELDFG